MNIKQIETFVRIVELGSFSAAAEALYASQSTVSARIKDLERYLGAELFDRSFHRAQLTPKGHEHRASPRDPPGARRRRHG
jgi:DNA-binding transcriptional LysR family regulator